MLSGKKKPISKSYILYDAIYIAFLKWQKYRHVKQISGCQGHGGREREMAMDTKW